MRQSEGNKTENRPSARRLIQFLVEYNESTLEAIIGPATAEVTLPARIRSSLLLKTASSTLRGHAPRGRSYLPSIAASRAARQRFALERSSFSTSRLLAAGNAITHIGKQKPIIPAKALSAADRFQQQEWQDIALRQ